ncbi:hypothetical protein GCM10028801_36000 [Nocardioides maradonensis]
MGRPKMQPVECSEPDCDRPTTARGLCPRHYNQVLRAERPTPKPARTVRPEIPVVVADFAYPDPHRSAPSGQRLVSYTCPACGKAHLTSWLADAENPGLKVASCVTKVSSGRYTNPMVEVLKPPPSRIFSSFSEYKLPHESASSTNGLARTDLDFCNGKTDRVPDIEKPRSRLALAPGLPTRIHTQERMH